MYGETKFNAEVPLKINIKDIAKTSMHVYAAFPWRILWFDFRGAFRALTHIYD